MSCSRGQMLPLSHVEWLQLTKKSQNKVIKVLTTPTRAKGATISLCIVMGRACADQSYRKYR